METPEIKLSLEEQVVPTNMKPGTAAAAATTTTTEVITFQWPSGAACKIERQVATTCPHGCQGTTNKDLATEQSNALPPPPPPAAVAAVAPELWVAEPNVMVQQLRELEPQLGDKGVALRVQLEEYTEEIERGKRESAKTGRDWFLALPIDVRGVLELARDEINDSLIAALPAPPAN